MATTFGCWASATMSAVLKSSSSSALMRMRADRAIDVVEALGDGQRPGRIADARRDRHHGADAGRPWRAPPPRRDRRQNPGSPDGSGGRRACSGLLFLFLIAPLGGERIIRLWPSPPSRPSSAWAAAQVPSRPPRDRRRAREDALRLGNAVPGFRRPLLPEHIEAACFGCKGQAVEKLRRRSRHHRLYEDGELANHLRRHVENGRHARRVGFALRPRLLAAK